MRYLIFCLMFLAVSVAAIDKETVGAFYLEKCSACHQATGAGIQDMGAPNIAGLPRKYLDKQLRNFRDGNRGKSNSTPTGQLMVKVTQELSLDQMTFLAYYVSKLKPTVKDNKFKEQDLLAGKAIYEKACIACHQPEAKGKKSLAPPLNIQPDWYLLTQMKDFINGARKHGELGVQIPKFSEVEQKDLVAYLASLSAKKTNLKKNEK